MNSKFLRRAGAVALAGAIIGGGLVSAQAANADVVAGEITLYGPRDGLTRGEVITSGSATQNPMFYSISIDAKCPAGAGGTQTWIWQDGVSLGAISTARTAAQEGIFGYTGLGANNVDLGDYWIEANSVYTANKALSGLTQGTIQDGPFELRFYCHVANADPQFATEPYFLLPLEYDSATTTWSVYEEPVPGIDTTTALTAAALPDDSVDLEATVKVQSTGVTAEDASGDIEFYEVGNATPLATVEVVDGVAEYNTGALADGQHAFTATFVPDDDVYEGSSSSAASVVIGAWATETTEVIVEIPSGVGELTLTGVPEEVYLDGDTGTAGVQPAVLGGGTLNATGSLGELTVTDTRQLDAPDWDLTGQIENFTSGGNTILARYLGWAPAYVSGPGEAGDTFAPGAAAGSGLETLRSLATGSVTDGEPETVVSAALNLAAPANTPAGTYSATLTITLI